MEKLPSLVVSSDLITSVDVPSSCEGQNAQITCFLFYEVCVMETIMVYKACLCPAFFDSYKD